MATIKEQIGRCGYCGEEKALRFMATNNLCSRCQDKVAIHAPVPRKREEVRRCAVCGESKTVRFMATGSQCQRCLVEALPEEPEDLAEETAVEVDGNDVVRRVTNAILALLDRGELPPWKQGFAMRPTTPRNGFSGHHYSGVNYWTTLLAQIENGWIDSRWLSEKQVWLKGGRVKAGQEPTEIHFCLRGGFRKDGTLYINRVKTHEIYNWAQIEGLPETMMSPLIPPFPSVEAAEMIIVCMPNLPHIQHFRLIDHPARYRIPEDLIEIPERAEYDTKERYYETLFHELAHCTGHPDRLGRFTIEGVENLHERGYEELTAEMTAAMLCDIAGIGMTTIENTASYVKSWADAIRAERNILLRASSAAERALNYIILKDRT